MRQAILAAIKLKDNDYFDETIKECVNLCEANNIEVIDTIIQTANSIDPNYGFRKGKIEELNSLVKERNVDLVVFYNNLNVSIVSNLQGILDVQVMDRTNLILDIFSSRASSKEAQIQIEMARLKYDLPKVLKEYMDEDRAKGGGATNRGLGETRSALVRRRMESRINDLRQELKDLSKRQETLTGTRSKTGIKKVALVGYTNAGKSSLMNALLKLNNKEDKKVFEKDMLFATLDTTCRSIKYKNYEFLLFDTVGFVSDLPHDLVEAFKSTLKAACDADLLLHIIDSSNSNYEYLKKVTDDTLKEIGAENIKIIDVYNKCDLLETRLNNLTYISTKTNEGLTDLLDFIVSMIYPKEKEIELLVPYNKLNLVNDFKNRLTFNELEANEEGYLYKIEGPEEEINYLNNLLKK